MYADEIFHTDQDHPLQHRVVANPFRHPRIGGLVAWAGGIYRSRTGTECRLLADFVEKVGLLYRLNADSTHFLRMGVEPRLNVFKKMFVLPTCDAALLAGGAFIGRSPDACS